MELGRISSIKFREITSSFQVRIRLKLVEKVQERFPGIDLILSPTLVAAQRIATKVAELNQRELGVYLCFGGDISTFIFTTGLSTFLCLDQWPFFFPLRGGFPRKIDDDPPEVFLFCAAHVKQRYGYLQNSYLKAFKEVGIFAFLEILSLGGKNLQVFAAEKDKSLFLITFDLKEEKYRVYFKQENLIFGKMPEILEDLPIGVILLKAGKNQKLENKSYRALGFMVHVFPVGTLIISDLEIRNNALELIPFTFGKDLLRVPFGYAKGKAFLYRVRKNF